MFFTVCTQGLLFSLVTIGPAGAGAGAGAGASSFRARFATCPAYCARYAIFCSIVVTGPYPSSVRLRLNDFLKLSMEWGSMSDTRGSRLKRFQLSRCGGIASTLAGWLPSWLASWLATAGSYSVRVLFEYGIASIHRYLYIRGYFKNFFDDCFLLDLVKSA